MENPTKMDDLGVAPFRETSKESWQTLPIDRLRDAVPGGQNIICSGYVQNIFTYIFRTYGHVYMSAI